MKSQMCLVRAAWNVAVVALVLVAIEPAQSRGQSSESVASDIAVFGPERGSLVICGGGVLPESLRRKVLDLAGGEHARLVVISTASQTADTPDVETYVVWWRQQKMAEMTILHTRSRGSTVRRIFPCRPLRASEYAGSSSRPLFADATKRRRSRRPACRRFGWRLR